MIAPKKSYMWAALLVVALIVGVILYFVLTGPTTTTTTKVSVGGKPIRAACEFWGDPHIKTFDGARPSFYGNGEFWVVKHPDVWIQGRYEGTSWTHGLAATSRLAIAGPFLGGHKIEIGTMDSGMMQVDGQNVMQGGVGSSYSIPGIADMTYSSQGNLVDDAQTEFARRVVTINLPKNIKIEVMRWPNYMDFRITMDQMPGQDGSCGNFNKDPADDKTEDIISRLGDQVHANDLLFNHKITSAISEEMRKMMEAECIGEQRSKAQADCMNEQGNEKDACMYDVCFGMNDHARKEALTFD